MKAMILAAGKGTRMRPLTDRIPKALLEVGGVSLLGHSILYFRHFGVRDFIVNVHHHAGQILDFLEGMKKFGVNIAVSDESDELLDTGGGLFKASWFFDDGNPFFLAACDAITDLDIRAMYSYHMLHKPLATLAVSKRKSTRDLLFDKELRLCGWHSNVTGETRMSFPVEDPLSFAFSTIHVIDPSIFGLLDCKGPFSMTEAYLGLAAGHRIMGYKHDSHWLEFGRIENLQNEDSLKTVRDIYARFH